MKAGRDPSHHFPESPHRASDGLHTDLRGRILVVDDDADVREIMSHVLRSAGHRVTSADDGATGWAALCADSFDVLITDHDMPRMSGLDLLRRVRARRLNLPVVFISGSMSPDEPELLQCLQPGVAMEKPFSLVDLLGTVRNFLTSALRHGEARDGQTPLGSNGISAT